MLDLKNYQRHSKLELELFLGYFCRGIFLFDKSRFWAGSKNVENFCPSIRDRLIKGGHFDLNHGNY